MGFKKCVNTKGFTLIELIITISILGILIMVSIPTYHGVIEKSKIAKDTSNLWVLNRVTFLYGHEKMVTNNDIFDGITTDNSRMQELISNGYIKSIIETSKKNTAFNWSIEKQKWIYSLYQTVSNPPQSYLFKMLDLDDFIKTGTWTKTQDGFYSGHGLLFVANKKSEYIITAKAKLSEGTTGGYGILFDSYLTEGALDSGYVLQFDRGHGGITIRERTLGVEKSPILVVTNRQNAIIPSSKRDDWWHQEHEIKLQVSTLEGQNGKKKLDVWIGNNKIIDSWSFQGNVKEANNISGFRSWHTGTSYNELTID